MSSPEQVDFLAQKNETFLKRASAEYLAHGAIFPIDVISHFCPNRSRPRRARIVEFGSGNSDKLLPLIEIGIRAFGLEINPGAFDLAWDRNSIPTFQDDVRHLQQEREPYALYQFIEEQHVLTQGLLPSMLRDKDIRLTLRTAHTLMLPRGFLFMAEPIHFGELDLFDFKLPESYNGPTLKEWQRRWFGRYAVNAQAGYPHGIFAVARGELPRAEKERLDWSNTPEQVREFVQSANFERYARHVRFVRLRRYLQKLHFQEIQTSPTIMFSRGDEPLLGVISVWQKQSARYKYRPFLRGTRVDDDREQERQLRLHLKDVDDPQEWMNRYIEQANLYLPPTMKIVEG